MSWECAEGIRKGSGQEAILVLEAHLSELEETAHSYVEISQSAHAQLLGSFW